MVAFSQIQELQFVIERICAQPKVDLRAIFLFNPQSAVLDSEN